MFRWAAVSGPVMGVVNVTPDSFSDGGRFVTPDAAIEHGHRLVAEGAAVLDIGGESTRPGADPVDAATETGRVVPVIEALAGRVEVPISVDTTKASVARAALNAGAAIVNDVSAGLADPDMLAVVADAGAGFVAMHMRGGPRTMQVDPTYGDVVAEVGEFLAERCRGGGCGGDRGRCRDGRSGDRFRQDGQPEFGITDPNFGSHRRCGSSGVDRNLAKIVPGPHRGRR